MATTRTRERRTVWLSLAAAFAVGIVIVGVLLVAQSGSEDGAAPTADGERDSGSQVASDGAFPIVAYRGADVLGGQELDLTTLLGSGRPVVLNFWAGQCPPCRAEMPAFQDVYDRLGDDFLLVGVDIGPFIGLGSRQSALDLLEELGITYPTAYALDARAVQDNRVLSMPTTIFYDAEGTEVGRAPGLLTEDSLEARVRELVGQA